MISQNTPTSGMPRRSFVGLLVIGSGTTLLTAACGSSGSQKAATAPGSAKEFTFYDTMSSPNFTQWWQTRAVSPYREQAGVGVSYTTSDSGTVLPRIQAARQGQGGIHLVQLAPDKFGAFARAGVLEDLRPLAALIPNMAKTQAPDNQTAAGVSVDGRGAVFLRYQYAGAYKASDVHPPPAGFIELFDRRAEWKGKISYVDPRSPVSGSGRYYVTGFLHAFGCDFGLKNGVENATWGPAWEKLAEFEKFGFTKHAQSTGEYLAQFAQGDIVIGGHAFDVIQYSKKIGAIPPDMKTTFMKEGLPGGAGYLAIPKGISQPHKEAAARFINFALSDTIQIKMVEEVSELPGTDVWDKLPASVYGNIPHEQGYMTSRIIPDPPLDAINYIAKVWNKKVGYGA